MERLKTILIAACVSLLLLSITAYALTSFTRTIPWNLGSGIVSFEVRDASGSLMSSGQNSPLITSIPYTESYQIINKGNVEILIDINEIWTAYGTSTWNVTFPLQIPIGAWTGVQVTLDNLEGGTTGSYQFLFTATQNS